MTKLSRKYLDSDKFGQYINNLWSGFTLMDSKEDIKLLFKDLFTHTEYKMFAKRLEIARRLLDGQGYDQIIKQLNVTERTISSINNTLADKGGGFRKVHAKLSEIEDKRRRAETERINKLSQAFRRPAGENVLGEIAMESLKFAGKKLTQFQKRRSAQRNLDV